MAEKIEQDPWRGNAEFWRVTMAFACMVLSTYVTNIAVFPLFDTVFTYARDISQTVQASCLVLIGVVATFRPRALRVCRAVPALAALGLVAIALMLGSFALGSPVLLVVSSSLFALVRAIAMVAVGIAAAETLQGREVPVSISFAFSLATALQAVCWVIPSFVGLVLYFVLPFAMCALVWSEARRVASTVLSVDAPDELAITRPSSFLPLASQVFASIFLFRLAFGFSLRFGESGGVPVAVFAMIVPVAVTALLFAYWRRFSADLLTHIAVVVVVCGFFLVGSSSDALRGVSNVLLSTGEALFYIVMWIVLVSVGSRNMLGSLAVIGWGAGIGAFGTLAGAGLGAWSNRLLEHDANVLALASGAILALFVGYALIGLRNFSFEEAINGVTPVAPDAKVESPEEQFRARCEEVVQAHGLTKREAEVFAMLARGRNREYIQETLVLSRSTVKTHVRHIYEKLGIHSHQELIDLFEGKGPAA